MKILERLNHLYGFRNKSIDFIREYIRNKNIKKVQKYNRKFNFNIKYE